MFSISDISSISLSVNSIIIAGTSFKPAVLAARHLLSPATIMYWSLSIFLKINGCIIPCVFIDSVNSAIFSVSNNLSFPYQANQFVPEFRIFRLF